MLSDFHLHTSFSGDSDTDPRLQIEKAILLDMKEICITDHHDFDYPSGAGIDFTLDFPRYFQCLRDLQAEYSGKIKVNIGVELGLQIHIKDYLEKLTHEYSFDFIIGSSHLINGMDLYYPVFFENKDEKSVYENFFEVSLKRIREFSCFDVYGHLDYVVRYGPDKNKYYNFNTYRDYIDPILKTLIEKGKGLECNTGGYKYGLGQPNPCEEILARYRELGGEILTIGSDAHVSQYVGYEFDKAKDLLLNCGFKYYTVFHNRKSEFIKI